MSTIIQDLEEQVEYWRNRAEAAEAAIGMGDQWHRAVAPLSLQMTRIMRLIAARPLTSCELADALMAEYPNTTVRTVVVRLCQIRQLLPSGIIPVSGGYNRPYAVKDPAALNAFLSGSALGTVNSKLTETGRQAA